jgi:hypothetical protein
MDKPLTLCGQANYGDSSLNYCPVSSTPSIPYMARLPRIVITSIPHHVTQRGNGRQQTIFDKPDYALYRDLLKEHAAANGT